MRWSNSKNTEWHKKFALFPVSIGVTTVWLESYERRFLYRNSCEWGHIDYYEYRLINK